MKILFLVCLIDLFDLSVAFNVTAWQNVDGQMRTMEWPEDFYLGSDIEKIGMTLSGGGDRSYTASIGYLAAMHELDIMTQLTHIVGVSGGSWATTVYSFYQDEDITDSTMLGPVIFPADINITSLGIIEMGCVRSFVNSTERLPGPTFEDWEDFIQVEIFPCNVLRYIYHFGVSYIFIYYRKFILTPREYHEILLFHIMLTVWLISNFATHP